MKKVLYIASMCLAMAFTSCDDFLTVSSPDKLTTGNFWRDQKDEVVSKCELHPKS